ncbi:glycosyltransferase family 2 protein [Rasiella sp. SM2506]|uniref:glycosyltransferase family 2 protein n=1 Tax=Rasiella sp. SM2506 TaxID=3423914 RepID=UPI003D794D42
MNISVIIPAYNAAAFLERAVQSVLQHPEVKELLLVEDGSTDDTLQVCQRLRAANTNVHVFQHPNGQNKGAGASRNLGIANATQEYIAFLDADDFYTARRFKKEKETFENYPDADGVYGAIGVEYLDAIGAKAWEAKGLDQETLTTVNKILPPDHLFEYIAGIYNADGYTGYFSIDGLTIKRNAIIKLKLEFDTSLQLHQDTVFMWQASYHLKLYTGEFELPIAVRGVHADNRFIHKNKLHASRSKQYKVLRDWGLQASLDKRVVNRFQLRFFRNYLRSKNSWEKPFFYMKLLLKDTYTRNLFGKKQLKIVKELTCND